ncbi:MAG: HAD-IA family hydrolase [Bacteroidaceae bacterium]|nr:HAD-IA family hydrolase [Prevotellaceae bacterium]MDY3062881.1 HAD-IA family hydrolase [Bacteroidaceae bacterium]
MKNNLNKYLKNHGFEQMRLKAVFFDMDGVLYDSMKNHAIAWVKASEDYNLGMSENDVYMNEGRTGFSTVDIFTQKQFGRNTSEEEVEEIYLCKMGYYNTLPEAQPMPGALSLLKQIKNDGFQIVLVTGSGQHSLLERLNHDYPDIFHSDLMVTGFDVKYGKPDPEPYLMAMQKAAVRPWEAMVVENAPLGVRSAVGAGAFTVACNTGPLPDTVFDDENANLILPSLQSLSDCWPVLRDTLS